MKQVHVGGYSVTIPDNYVHSVKVSRVKGSQDVRIRLSKNKRSAATTSAFAQYPCWEATYTNLALWDTGAEMSGVSEELAVWLNLEQRDVGMLCNRRPKPYR